MRLKAIKLGGCSLLLLSGHTIASPACSNDKSMWTTYKKNFVTREGRVVDNGNRYISHSEGQGYGMLIAEHFGDKKTFDRVWEWTQVNLGRKQDDLFSWKWQPKKPHVPDINNASDGDILIAWALLRAEQRWSGNQYRAKAKRIINELEQSHLKDTRGEFLLLPGGYGFEFSDKTIANLAYWVFPAFDDFSQFDSTWSHLSVSGMDILNKNLYGHHLLPPDWLEIGKGGWQPAKKFEPQFSYSNYRIPLHLIWGERPHRVTWMFNNWLKNSDAAWVNVNTGETAPYPPPKGAIAISQLVEAASNPKVRDKGITVRPEGKDYYSDSLVLLSHIAYNERFCQ
ncbi:hypothetical protein TUMSATVNIG1_39910 [Vibrio nigripulchritudo]|uniref:glycosyl hydrolase family 8 n=1 Tax=Vibrio nigripulchritudo TaxID=28173 RepID=UPI00190DA57E|nr:glycosyl hydrolase family 8 [Vibrio nigripulchritudo]BCL72024.1 hypothetical protein VNTUMSATTG_39610 [Vibrio nigripulchritudo]BDU33382.1 hypothetical protein TUMSATVNIG1_39910 [Vibrio nigripulchritudo]